MSLLKNYNELVIYNYLPLSLRRGTNQLILAVFETLKKELEEYFVFWFGLAEVIDPMTVNDGILDFLALRTGNPWRDFWDSDWNESAKRNLLRDTVEIFSKRLFPETLTLLFTDFELGAYLRPKSGFILGTVNPPASLLPATLGLSIYDYEVVIPKNYYQGSTEYLLVKYIAENFGIPGKIPIVYET